jgi:hypothetical protein
MVDAKVWRQVQDEARESPVTLLEYPRAVAETVREALRGL